MEIFERNTYSVVNIFYVTLCPQLNMTGMIEVSIPSDKYTWTQGSMSEILFYLKESSFVSE